ncbi:MAG: glycosyltransferase family 1 protein [bacterium]|nr:glycosyltransferase family 1 protein [bacterium]
MRIGIDSRATVFEKVGLGTYTKNLIEVIKKIDSTNTYITYKKAWGVKLCDHFRGDAWEQIWLPLKLKEDKIDVYHGTVARLPLIKFPNIKYVVTIHDLIPIISNRFCSKQYKIYMGIMFKISTKSADKIIANSYFIKDEIINTLGVEEGKIEVVYLGASGVFRRINKTEAFDKVSKLFGIKKQYILTVGNIEPRKNIKSLFNAYKLLKREGYDYQLVIVGPIGWQGEKILSEIKDNDVIFTNYVSIDELFLLYNGAEVFVLVSFYEGFGLPILEAMKCGVPIIASNVSSIPEILSDAGIKVSPHNVEEIKDAIIKVIENRNLREELIDKGIERSKLFTWELSAKKTLEVYKKVYNL